MTRRDFVLIADAISNADYADPRDRSRVAVAMADRLAGTNPNFDRDRFIDAAIGMPHTKRDSYSGRYGRT